MCDNSIGTCRVWELGGELCDRKKSLTHPLSRIQLSFWKPVFLVFRHLASSTSLWDWWHQWLLFLPCLSSLHAKVFFLSFFFFTLYSIPWGDLPLLWSQPSYPCSWFLNQYLSWSLDTHLQLPSRNPLLSGPRVAQVSWVHWFKRMHQNHLQPIFLLRGSCPISCQIKSILLLPSLPFFPLLLLLRPKLLHLFPGAWQWPPHLFPRQTTFLYVAARASSRGHL